MVYFLPCFSDATGSGPYIFRSYLTNNRLLTNQYLKVYGTVLLGGWMLLMMKRLRHRTTTTATQMDTRVVAASTVAPVANLREGAESSGMLLNFAIDCAHFHLASPGLFFFPKAAAIARRRAAAAAAKWNTGLLYVICVLQGPVTGLWLFQLPRLLNEETLDAALNSSQLHLEVNWTTRTRTRLRLRS